jgi:hypothetical protein
MLVRRRAAVRSQEVAHPVREVNVRVAGRDLAEEFPDFVAGGMLFGGGILQEVP